MSRDTSKKLESSTSRQLQTQNTQIYRSPISQLIGLQAAEWHYSPFMWMGKRPPSRMSPGSVTLSDIWPILKYGFCGSLACWSWPGCWCGPAPTEWPAFAWMAL